MNKVELIPFVTDRRSYRVCIDEEWLASIHTHPHISSCTTVTMLWADSDCPPEVAGCSVKGGMPEAYQWAMRMFHKYPEWTRPWH